MKISKILYILVAIISSAFFTGCDDGAEYTPGAFVPENCMQVYFSGESPTYDVNPKVALETKLTFTLNRVKTESAATVPIAIKQFGGSAGVFSLLTEAKFAAGDATTKIEVGVNTDALGDYLCKLIIVGDEFNDPYAVLPHPVTQDINLEIVVWNNIGTGTYVFNSPLGDVTPPQSGMVLEQKDSDKTIYRIKNWGLANITFMFNVNEKNKISVPVQQSGIVHDEHGMMWLTTSEVPEAPAVDPLGLYVKETGIFNINMTWYMPGIGYFGVKNGSFTLDSVE